MGSKNVWAILNIFTKKVVAETTHYQLAAEIEDDLIATWKASFVGPQQQTILLPFTACRIDALHRFYPGFAA